MKLQPLLLIVALLIWAATMESCGDANRRHIPHPAKEKRNIGAEADKWADSVCESLTLKQKVAQMFMPAVYASSDVYTLAQVAEYADSCVGGIVLLKGDSAGVVTLVDSISAASRVVPFIAIDAEWGLAMRLCDAPRFPENSEISLHAADSLMYQYGREIARECRLLGINMVLGPVVDVVQEGSVMKRRSFGRNPLNVARMALAYAGGLEEGGVIGVAKHFPGHGSVSVDSHKMKGIISRSLHEMDSVDIYPFRKWAEKGFPAVMVGHLAVPSIDSEMKPAAVSKVVIMDLLRGDVGFKGLVMTDALNMGGASGYGSVDAVIAGADIIIAPVSTFADIAAVVDAVNKGTISEAEIDEHVKRILHYKYIYCILKRQIAHSDTHVASLRVAHADSISAALVR